MSAFVDGERCALRGRADLRGPGRVGVRLLRAAQRPPLASRARGRAAARADPRAARRQLPRLRLPADVEGAAARRRAGAALPRAAPDARATGIVGRSGAASRGARRRPIRRRRGGPISSQRDFSASRPNRLWVADLSYLRCWEGLVYFAFVIDAFSRMIVGWQLATHMRTDLVARRARRWRSGCAAPAPTSSSSTTRPRHRSTPASTTPDARRPRACSPRSARDGDAYDG